MRTAIRNIHAGLALCLLASTASAQPQVEGNPREAVRTRFEASGLRVGSQFPDLQIVDAQGKPFRTAELKGNFTVLVTGCLT